MIYCLVRHTKNLLVLKQLYFVATLFWAGVIAFFCLVQIETVPLGNVSNLDKVVHLFFHFVLTILCFSFLQKHTNSVHIWKSTLPAFLFSFIFGIGIEITQELATATRHADVFDVLANVSGAILGIVVVLLLNLKKRF